MAQTDYESINDEGLMERIRDALDHQAFCHIVKRHTDRFYRAAYRICQNEVEAEDIVQDAFLKIWQKPKIWKAGQKAKFTTWFYRIVVNMAIDVIRKRKSMIPDGGSVIDVLEDKGDLADEGLVRKGNQQALERAISALPEQQNVALNLCFYEGVSNKDAAEIMGIGVKALESLLIRAKKNIKDTLLRDGVLEGKEEKHG